MNTRVLLFLCMSSVAAADFNFDRVVFPNRGDSGRVTILKINKIQEAVAIASKVADKKPSVIFVSTDCPVGVMSFPVFQVVAETYKEYAHFYRISPATYKPDPGSKSPTFLFVQNGLIVDKEYGFFYPDGRSMRQLRWKQALESFVVRNVFGFEASVDLMFLASPRFIEGLHLSQLQNVKFQEPPNFSGHDMARVLFSGVDLHDADFRGANLEGSQFWNANLYGAKLQGAKLEGTIWRRTVCPDGYRIGDSAGSCLSHLKR